MICLFADGSPTGTGGWICQGPTRDTPRPAAFHSRKLTLSQSNYPRHKQETLAIIEAMEAFAPHLLHRQVTVVTDYESLTKLMTQKNLNGPQQRWLTYVSRFDFKIDYKPGAKNFLADSLLRIHEGTLEPSDISLKDPTIDYDILKLRDPTQPLQINTRYAAPTNPTIESGHAMYHSDEAPTAPTLTSSDSIHHCRPVYLMHEIASNAVTRSPKHKATAPSPATSRAPSNDRRITIGNSWGDNRTLPISSELEQPHSEMSCMSCTDDGCEIHKNQKEGAGYRPRILRSRSRVTRRREQSRLGLQHQVWPLRRARPRFPISSTSLIAYHPSA